MAAQDVEAAEHEAEENGADGTEDQDGEVDGPIGLRSVPVYGYGRKPSTAGYGTVRNRTV